MRVALNLTGFVLLGAALFSLWHGAPGPAAMWALLAVATFIYSLRERA